MKLNNKNRFCSNGMKMLQQFQQLSLIKLNANTLRISVAKFVQIKKKIISDNLRVKFDEILLIFVRKISVAKSHYFICKYFTVSTVKLFKLNSNFWIIFADEPDQIELKK